jgi:flagellar hook-associated protein FlgK
MSITSIAVSGMNAAKSRLAVSADNVANANTPDYRAKQVNQASQAEGGVRVQVSQAAAEGVSLEQEAVNQQIASYDFKANAKLLRVQQELDKSLLDIQA